AAAADERRLEPALELGAAGVGEPVVDPIGPVRLRDGAPRDEPVADEPVEDLVQVADVELAPLRPDRLFEGGFEFIAVARLLREKREHCVMNRHRALYLVTIRGSGS